MVASLVTTTVVTTMVTLAGYKPPRSLHNEQVSADRFSSTAVYVRLSPLVL